MNLYVIGTLITVVILGLFIIYANASEREYERGYNDAVEAYRQQTQNAIWQQYINQIQGGHDEEEQDE
jgi:hypothetical protein